MLSKKLIKLKTFEQIEKEFRPISISWNIKFNGNIYIKVDKYDWCINKRMIQYFGTCIEVKERKMGFYTHEGVKIGWRWRESWFENEFGDFLKEEEMKI